LKLSFTVFLTQDEAQANALLKSKQALRDKERKAVNAHLERLRKGPTMDEVSSAMHLGLLSDLRRINSMITSVAYPVLQKKEKIKAASQKNETKKKDKSKKKLDPARKF
jgi:phosphate:Na+ symporter